MCKTNDNLSMIRINILFILNNIYFKNNMIINISNPFNNTIIVFVSIMVLLYIIKPETLYDNNKKEFKQFGVEDGKTLLPIYIVGILLAIILYVLFNQLAKIYNSKIIDNSTYNISHEYLETERDSELSSLKNQIMMMNQTITQMNQLNQINQLNQLNQLNQMNHLKMNKYNNNQIPRISDSRYDKSGIYNSNNSNNSNNSIRSIDAGYIIDSVLASTRPSDSYNISNGGV